MDSNCCSEPISNAAVEEDGICGLVIEVFDDLDKVCADVVLLHGCPQSCMSNPIEGPLEVCEDMVEVLLVLEIFLTESIKEEYEPWKRGGTARYYASPTKIMLATRKSVPRSSRQFDRTKTSSPS